MSVSVHILVVEDSNIQAHNLNRILTRRGFSVQLCPDARSALDYLAAQTPDVIITDIMMPGMDGFEFCRLVKNSEAWRRIPIILLTELSDPLDVFQGLKSGADCFVTKPYDDDFLIERIHTVIENVKIRATSRSNGENEIVFKGKRYEVNSTLSRATDLLFATYENAMQKNRELIRMNRELSEAKRELQRQNSELAELHEEKNRFIGIAAHDVRSPLGIVLGYSEILMEDGKDTLDQAQLKLLKQIHDSSQFMLELVNDLLDVARIEAGHLDLNLGSVQLLDLVADAVELHRLTATARGILIESNLPLDLPPLRLDSSRMTQVINNLLDNAIKYSPEGGMVDIFARREGDRVTLYVRDRGPGIPTTEQEKLFQPFGRTSVKPGRGEKSTGLGLAIVKKIVEGHGGRVAVESAEGRGTTFSVSLPIGSTASSSPADRRMRT